MNIVLFSIPFFLLLIVIEILLGNFQQKKLYTLSDTITNLNIGLGNRLLSLLSKMLILQFFILVSDRISFFNLSFNVWTVLLCLVLYDFIFYWVHRWSHEVNILWGMHVVHHSSEEYNLSVALRQSWFQDFATFIFFLPLPLLGFNPETILTALGISALYQFMIHTKVVGKLPSVVEFFFNTPSHHRVHHSVNPKYIDKNHGGVFIIWDRLFGTYQLEEEVPVYGITNALDSLNPIWANFHYYQELWLKKSLSSWERIFILPFRSPTYAYSLKGGEKDVVLAKEKVDSLVSINRKYYVLVHFLLVFLAAVVFLIKYNELSVIDSLLSVTLLFYSMLVFGYLLENKKQAYLIEGIRLVLSVSFIGYLIYKHSM